MFTHALRQRIYHRSCKQELQRRKMRLVFVYKRIDGGRGVCVEQTRQEPLAGNASVNKTWYSSSASIRRNETELSCLPRKMRLLASPQVEIELNKASGSGRLSIYERINTEWGSMQCLFCVKFRAVV